MIYPTNLRDHTMIYPNIPTYVRPYCDLLDHKTICPTIRRCVVPHHDLPDHTMVYTTIRQRVLPHHDLPDHTMIYPIIPGFARPYHGLPHHASARAPAQARARPPSPAREAQDRARAEGERLSGRSARPGRAPRLVHGMVRYMVWSGAARLRSRASRPEGGFRGRARGTMKRYGHEKRCALPFQLYGPRARGRV